jgi:hypothetical protein
LGAAPIPKEIAAGYADTIWVYISYVFPYHIDNYREVTPMSIAGRRERDTKVGRILLWEGRVSRGRLIAEYGLSPIRASEWLRDFRESYPEWVAWDNKLKADVATSIAYADAERAANAKRQSPISTMLIPYTLNVPGKPQSISWEFAHISPRTFSRLNLAIADRLRVRFVYCSMNTL